MMPLSALPVQKVFHVVLRKREKIKIWGTDPKYNDLQYSNENLAAQEQTLLSYNN